MEKDPEAAGPGDVAYSTWSQRLWCELSEEVLGPEWRKQLKMGKKTPRLPQSGAPHLEPSTSALVAKTERTLPPTSKAGGAPVPTSSLESGIRGLLERGTRVLRDADAASAQGEKNWLPWTAAAGVLDGDSEGDESEDNFCVGA